MLRFFVFVSLLFVGAVDILAQNENPICENFYFKDSDKPYAICEYDFGKEKTNVLISKECIFKTCEAYKAYEQALTIRNVRVPGDTDHDWGVINCKDLNGSLLWLSNNRQVSGEVRFCKFNDFSFISDIFLNTSRSIDKNGND